MDLDYFNSDLLLYYHQYYYFYKFSSRFGGHTSNITYITYYYHGAPRPDQPTNFYLLLPTKQLFNYIYQVNSIVRSRWWIVTKI